jgi:hypothetical protein
MRTWARAAATAISLAALLSGCADSQSSEANGDPTGPSTPSSSSPTPSDPSETSSAEEDCPYLTVAQVTAALGIPVSQTAGSTHACFFDPAGGTGPSVMLSRINVQIDPADYAAQTKALCQGEVTDVDLGDEAFACVMGLGPQGQLYVGKALVTVNVNGAADDATGISMAEALLHDVTIPPES